MTLTRAMWIGIMGSTRSTGCDDGRWNYSRALPLQTLRLFASDCTCDWFIFRPQHGIMNEELRLRGNPIVASAHDVLLSVDALWEKFESGTERCAFLTGRTAD